MFGKRDAVNFLIVGMPSIRSSVLSMIFYGSTMSEFVRIAKSILLLKSFLPAAKNLEDRMINQEGSKQILFKKIKEAFNTYPEDFQKYIMASDIVSKIVVT